MPILTTKDCQRQVRLRTKIYDSKCSGLYVSVTPSGVATFYFKYTNPNTKKRGTALIGVFHEEHLSVPTARAEADSLRGRIGKGEDIEQAARVEKKAAAVTGTTVADLVDQYIAYIKVDEKKPWGGIAPRTETWSEIEGYLYRSVRRKLGARIASGITKSDIASLQHDIISGKYGKASISNARNTRTATSGMFKWAAEAGREMVPANPCRDLPKLPPEITRKRVLTEAEIRHLWWGLDRVDLPCTREVALGLKLELTTMLRTKEFIGALKSEVNDLDTSKAVLTIAPRRVKKRRVINQPLNDLAQDVVRELLRGNKTSHLFPGRGAGTLDRAALSHAVRGQRDKDGEIEKQGILDFLGMKHWTPHDLRRTASTLLGEVGFSKGKIGLCLDHRSTDDDDDQRTREHSVTGRVYDHSVRLKEKREVLDALSGELSRIIGKSPKLLTLRIA